jgi:hypothetical protein
MRLHAVVLLQLVLGEEACAGDASDDAEGTCLLQLQKHKTSMQSHKKKCPIWMKKDGRYQNVYEKCTGGDCADGLFCCPSGMCMDSDTGSTQGPNCLRAQGHLDTCRLARNGQCNYHYPSPEDPSCRVGSDCTDCGKERAEWKCRPGEADEMHDEDCEECEDEDSLDFGRMKRKAMPAGKERCRGRAVNKFGRGLTEAQCKAKCMESSSCKVIMYHLKSKLCNEMKHCKKPRKTKSPWAVYEKCEHCMSKPEIVSAIAGEL